MHFSRAAEILANDNDWKTRDTAAERLDDQELITGIALSHESESVRAVAASRLEDQSLLAAVDAIGDNLLWETDFPHPTCMHPGPANGLAQHPRDYVNAVMADLDEQQAHKILHSTAARLYGLE